MNGAPRVSVVIPTYRRPELLARCLDAVLAQSLDRDAYEVIIVDDADEPQTIDTATRYRRAGLHIRRLATSGQCGPAVARNIGWRAARASRIAFTDDDTIPARDWLANGLNALAEPRVAIWGRIVVPTPACPTDYERNTKGLETAEFATANVFVTRAALEQVGGFDERFRRAWREDADLYFSLIERVGEVAHEPAAVVVHPVRPGRWGECLRQHSNLIFDALLYKKHPVLYRSRLRPRAPLGYYFAVVGGIAVMVLAAFGPSRAWLAPLPLLALPVLHLAGRRLSGTSPRLSDRFEVLVTSLLIPFFAVYWRLRGALRYRVPFL